MTAGQDTRRRTASFTAHVLGNILCGVAIGLLVYTFLTDYYSQYQQRTLVRRFAAEEAAAAPVDRPDATAKWARMPEGAVLGRLTIPSIRLDSIIVKGTSRSSLMKAPGWIEGTDPPGLTGNFGIAGHRTTYGAPFRRLDDIDAGDIVRFTSSSHVYTYKVRRVFSVTPDRTEVLRSTERPVLTLSACHPPYSARFRLIARSELETVTVRER